MWIWNRFRIWSCYVSATHRIQNNQQSIFIMSILGSFATRHIYVRIFDNWIPKSWKSQFDLFPFAKISNLSNIDLTRMNAKKKRKFLDMLICVCVFAYGCTEHIQIRYFSWIASVVSRVLLNVYSFVYIVVIPTRELWW